MSFLDTHSFRQADGFGVSEVKTKARQYLCPDISGREISHSTSYNTAQSLSTAFHPWGILCVKSLALTSLHTSPTHHSTLITQRFRSRPPGWPLALKWAGIPNLHTSKLFWKKKTELQNR